MTELGVINKTIQVRATESNAHYLGIMMGASVRRDAGRLVIIRHGLYLEVPLGHWITLKGGEHTIAEERDFAF